MSSIKARDQTINALMIPCLRKAIERVKNLKKEKIFITLVKGKVPTQNVDFWDEIEQVENSKFLFLT